MTVPAGEQRLHEEPRTPEQMKWIRDRFKPDGLLRLARSTQDYYDSHGAYLPDVAALAYENGRERDAAVREAAELREALRDLLDNGGFGHSHWRERGSGGTCHTCETQQQACTRARDALEATDPAVLVADPAAEETR